MIGNTRSWGQISHMAPLKWWRMSEKQREIKFSMKLWDQRFDEFCILRYLPLKFLIMLVRIFFNKMCKIIRGKCQPTNDEIGFMKWIGKWAWKAEAQLSWVFGVEYKKTYLSKLEIWRWEGRGQYPVWPEWRNSRDARTHLKMIRGGWWVIGDG